MASQVTERTIDTQDSRANLSQARLSPEQKLALQTSNPARICRICEWKGSYNSLPKHMILAHGAKQSELRSLLGWNGANNRLSADAPATAGDIVNQNRALDEHDTNDALQARNPDAEPETTTEKPDDFSQVPNVVKNGRLRAGRASYEH